MRFAPESLQRRPILTNLLLGTLTAAALPPFTLVPILILAIPALLHQIGTARTWRGAAWRGWLFGFALSLTGLYWVTNAVLVMAAQFWWAVPITVPLLSAVLALFIAVPCAAARLMPAGFSRLLVLAGLWVLGDIARQFILSGFPWNLLGSVWEMPGLPGLIFMQPAAWIGTDGLTLATIILFGSLAARDSGQLFTTFRGGALPAAALLAVWGAAGTIRLQQAAPPTTLHVVIAQGNISEQDHRDHGMEPAWADRVFDHYLALTRQGVAKAGAGPFLVVWPETASPYALAQDTGARAAIAEAARPALMTISGTERFESRDVAHNSMVAITPDGTLAGYYDKTHLVPYGEYTPSYAHILLGEQGFVPGPGLQTLHLPGLPPIGPTICYEAAFPSQVVLESDRPQLLVNITNDAWFGDSAGPRQHLAAARMRTVEEGLPMLRAANTGISAVIDSHGRILSSLGLDVSGTLVAAVPGSLAPTPISRLGLWIPGLLAFSSVLLGLIARGTNVSPVQKNG